MMNNLKLVTLSLVMLCTLGVSYGQHLSYGLKVGSNFAVQSQIGDLYDNDDFRTGLEIGVVGNYHFNSNLSLKTEINYSQLGSKNDFVTKAYDYITVPVLAQYSLAPQQNEVWQFGVFAGPYASYLLKAEKIYDSSEKQDVEVTDAMNEGEVGLIYGLLVKYPIHNHSLVFNLKFGMGLTPFDESDTDIKNKHMGISLAYEF